MSNQTVADQLSALGFKKGVNSGSHANQLGHNLAAFQGYTYKGKTFIHILLSEKILKNIGTPSKINVIMNGQNAVALVAADDNESGAYSVYRHGGRGSKHLVLKITARKMGFDDVNMGVFSVPENHITYIGDTAVALSIPAELKV